VFLSMFVFSFSSGFSNCGELTSSTRPSKLIVQDFVEEGEGEDLGQVVVVTIPTTDSKTKRAINGRGMFTSHTQYCARPPIVHLVKEGSLKMRKDASLSVIHLLHRNHGLSCFDWWCAAGC